MNKLIYIFVPCIFSLSLSACDEKKMATPGSGVTGHSISDVSNYDASNKEQDEIISIKKSKVISDDLNHSIPEKNHNLKSDSD
jgi:hypothetical protein